MLMQKSTQTRVVAIIAENNKQSASLTSVFIEILLLKNKIIGCTLFIIFCLLLLFVCFFASTSLLTSSILLSFILV